MRRQKLQLLASGAAPGAVLAASGSAAVPSQPVNVTNTPLPIRVTSLPLAVTVVPGKSVNAFNQVSGVGNQVFNHVFTIPAGKRLLIDYVSAQGRVPAGDAVFDIHINNPVVHFFVVSAQGTDLSGKSVFTAAQPLRATIGPFAVRTDVIVRMERKMYTGQGPTLSLT